MKPFETLAAQAPQGAVLDLIGIGLGPFNLGLAALTHDLPDVDGVFLEAREDFSWHPGMMLEGATIQVPFMADLVTMADPTSRFGFLNHLKQVGRLYPFYIREDFNPLRAEYDQYCRWVAEQLDTIRWGHTVTAVERDAEDGVYTVTARRSDGTLTSLRARHVVLGIGTEPAVPPVAEGLGGPVTHSGGYLDHRAALQDNANVTVVGSGQSAAEIYLDLLEGCVEHGYHLTWVTRSPRFFPMEYTKLTLEMTSPEYARYFSALPLERRDVLLREQRNLYKGISADLVDTIYDTLYRLRVETGRPVQTTLLTNSEVREAGWDEDEGRYTLRVHHEEQDASVTVTTEGLVLATGYRPRTPHFLAPVADRIRRDARDRFDTGADYSVDLDGRIFVQNAEEHTHSVLAPDLGMGAYRNSVIINAIAGREVYPVEERIAFQHFGVHEIESPVVERDALRGSSQDSSHLRDRVAAEVGR
ncbi:lysine N(6)-hydroxylase/L-ornithine N(5)-oxygenase family protein [Janibacter anophelis]|uniref:lysine N(6)-hydroxylase/L-ornithine N(5)-oxygenase family protein n=1 Tax=Janibacter anophelis TaxID=319054 RepID=UPI000DEFDC07|nr:SidA/IucD/PvdA family monooxygenase [Janibacter anophelis]